MQLIELLKSFTITELNKLDKFVKSPFFYEADEPKKVIRLFDYLKNFAPDYDHPDVDRKVICKKMKWSEKKRSQVSSYLERVIKKFIAYESLDVENEGRPYQLALASFYRDRKLMKRFDTAHKKIYSEITLVTKEDYEYLYQIHVQNMEFQATYNPQKDLNLPDTIKSLEVSYFTFKLNYIYHLLIRSQNIAIEKTSFIYVLEEVSEFISRNPASITPLINIYYRAIQYLVYPTDAHFEAFEQAFTQNATKLGNEDISNLNIWRRSVLAKHYNNGKQRYLPKLFRLYQDHLSSGYLYQKGYISPSTFRNIVQQGTRLGEYKWVEEFIKTHQIKLFHKESEDICRISYAYLFVHTGDFEKAQDMIVRDFSEPIYKLDARRIELMIFYELKFPRIEPFIESFRKAVSNEKLLPDMFAKANYTFALVFRKLCDPRTHRNNHRINNLVNEILSSDRVIEDCWLFEKLLNLRERTRIDAQKHPLLFELARIYQLEDLNERFLQLELLSSKAKVLLNPPILNDFFNQLSEKS
jgi:hypothetical protein